MATLQTESPPVGIQCLDPTLAHDENDPSEMVNQNIPCTENDNESEIVHDEHKLNGDTPTSPTCVVPDGDQEEQTDTDSAAEGMPPNQNQGDNEPTAPPAAEPACPNPADDDTALKEEIMLEIQQEQKVIAKAMALNDAFSALENMRKCNLEVEYGGKAIPDISLFHQYCTACLHEEKEREEAFLRQQNNNSRGRQWRKAVLGKISRKKKSPPCLICASPVCNKHGCREFRKEGITICGHCAPLFTMDFVVDTISNDQEEHRRQCIAHMIDSYDRALLMLQYSCQFIEDIAMALENSTRKNNQIGLGSSGIGLMSGLTGMAAVAAHFAAAATILSPAGPPLLIASILFGGTAAAASTGTEAIIHYSEPNQLANKIVALHELVHSLLAVTAVMKEALRKGHIDVQQYMDSEAPKSFRLGKGRANAAPARRIKHRSTSVCSQESAASASSEDRMEALLVNPETVPAKTDNRSDEDSEKASEVPDETETTCSSVGSGSDEFIKNKDDPANDKSSDIDTSSMPEISEPEVSEASETTKPIEEATKTTNTNVVVAPSNTRTAASRAATNAMKVAQIATIACGVLSAATIVMEAKNMNDTLKTLRAGSPCEKAQMLREIKKQVALLPDTKVMAEECEIYLRVIAKEQNLY